MTLTPAKTLTPIAPPPAALPADGSVLVQADTVLVQADTEPASTPTHGALPVETAPPTASAQAPVETAPMEPEPAQAGDAPPAAPEPAVQESPQPAPEVVPVQAPPQAVPTPTPAVPAPPAAPPAPAPAKPLPSTPPVPPPGKSPSPTAPAQPPVPPPTPTSRTAVAQAATAPTPPDVPALPDAPLPPDASAPPSQAQVTAPAAPQPATSALGLGLGRLRIQLDGDRARTTVHDVETISGTLVGAEAGRLRVQVGDVVLEPALEGRAFSTSVPLVPGRNHVRVVAAGAQGGEVEETVTIDYHAPIGLTIRTPRDGHTLTPEDPPLVVVEGSVEDRGVSSVWVAAGERRVAVPVVAGRFRHTVPVLASTVQVRVEAPAMEGRAPASAAVTVHAAAPSSTVALLLQWPRAAAVPTAVAATWRARADRTDGVQRVPLETAVGDASPDFFYVRNPRPGVYTFVLTYHPGAPEAVQPALYVPAADRRLRTLRPVPLNGSGRVVIARVLMPHGVLWEDDDWFTGRSANGDVVTKFRFPDAITWTERTGSAAR
jgi:hypothetical protein